MIRTFNRVALYARFSSDNQRSESIDAQVRAMKAYCKQHGYVIIHTYVDEAKSATTDRRPGFQQMIADSREGLFDILLVHKLDRFARDRYDSAVYKRELRKNGVVVKSVLENLDNSPESIMMESVLEGMSEYYSQNLAREVMKGMRETALQCKHTGGKPPLGYDVDPQTQQLVINEEEAQTVNLIFTMYAAGQGYSAILDVLHANGLLTKRGQEFSKNSLYSILINPKYRGVYVFNQRSSKGLAGKRNNHSYKDAEDIIRIEGGCPQIVDAQIFDKVQERLMRNKHSGLRNHAKETYTLSGKVFCKECGKSMCGSSRLSGRDKTRYVTYRCPTRKHSCGNREINRDYLDQYIVALVEEKILNPAALRTITKRIQKRAQNGITLVDRRQEAIRTELSEVNEALRNVADAIAQGLISTALITRLNELEEKKALLEGQVIYQSAEPLHTEVDPQVILTEYADVKDAPASPAYKDFLCGFIERIDVGRYVVDITLKTGLDIFPDLNTTYTVKRQLLYTQKGAAS